MATFTPEQKQLQRNIQNNFQVKNSISFAKANPAITYEELSDLLGIDVAPIQLIWLIADESLQLSQVDWFVKDALVREMHAECPHGWHYEQYANFETAGAIASWISTIGYLGEEVVAKAKVACEKLKSIAPEGWLPMDISDSIIQEAFESISFN